MVAFRLCRAAIGGSARECQLKMHGFDRQLGTKVSVGAGMAMSAASTPTGLEDKDALPEQTASTLSGTNHGLYECLSSGFVSLALERSASDVFRRRGRSCGGKLGLLPRQSLPSLLLGHQRVLKIADS